MSELHSAIVRIPLPDLTLLFENLATCPDRFVIRDWPTGARIRSAHFSYECQSLDLVVEAECIDRVPDGCLLRVLGTRLELERLDLATYLKMLASLGQLSRAVVQAAFGAIDEAEDQPWRQVNPNPPPTDRALHCCTPDANCRPGRRLQGCPDGADELRDNGPELQAEPAARDAPINAPAPSNSPYNPVPVWLRD